MCSTRSAAWTGSTCRLPARNEIERKVEVNAWTEPRNQRAPDELARIRAVLALEWGTPSVDILRHAKTHAIDLIVMATDAAGAQHLLIGSVAEEVVPHAPCPVLTVRRPERQVVRPSTADGEGAEHAT